jgi:hypothetical protein
MRCGILVGIERMAESNMCDVCVCVCACGWVGGGGVSGWRIEGVSGGEVVKKNDGVSGVGRNGLREKSRREGDFRV